MIKKLIFTFLFIFILAQSAYAENYISNNRTTYIGETDLYYCYIYDTDVNLVIRFSDFHESGNWSATIALVAKTEIIRQKFITHLDTLINDNNLYTILMPTRDNELWAVAMRLTYSKKEDMLIIKDDYWLNFTGGIIALSQTPKVNSNKYDYPEEWKVKDLADKHIHKRYQEEYERRNTVVR